MDWDFPSHTQVADGRSKYFGCDCDIPDFNKKQPWPSFLAKRLKIDASFEKPCVETGQGNDAFVLVYGNMGCPVTISESFLAENQYPLRKSLYFVNWCK